MYMHTYTQTYIYTCTYIFTCTYAHIHAHAYTYACICTRMQRWKILGTTPQRVKQYHRRTYAFICIYMHTHLYTYTHMYTTYSECVADAYVSVKTHLCNINTCPCTSAHNTCKVHVTLTAKQMYVYIYTYTHMYTHAYTHENTCACMTPSTHKH